MIPREQIAAIAFMAALSATPALSSTVESDIILTDFGFRQIADCAQVWPRHVWIDGHYWSVRPSWECADVPYGGGKVPVMAMVVGLQDAPLAALFAHEVPVLSNGVARAVDAPRANWPMPPFFGGPGGPIKPPPRAPGGSLPSVPLPATVWLLIAALGALVFAKRNRQGLLDG